MKRYNWLPLIVVALLACFGLVPPAAALPMAFMGATETTTTLNEMMKVMFDDTFIPEVVLDTELMDWFPEGQAVNGPDGRYFETAQLYQFPTAVGFRGEAGSGTGYIPQASGGKALNGRINLKKIVGSLQESAETLKKLKGDRTAFANWSEEVFPLFKQSYSNTLDKALLGTGSGIKARVNDATPATTLVVDSALGIAGLDRALTQFQVGQHLRASPNADGSSPRTGTMTVTDIDWANEAIVVDALATSLADNDYLAEGDAADNSFGKATMGMFGLIDDGNIVQTLQYIDRSTYKWFQSYVHDGGADVVSEAMLLEADRIARLRGAGRVDSIVTSEDAFNAVWKDLKADRVINDPRSFTGGRKDIDILFGGTRTVQIRTARSISSTVVFGLQRDQIRRFVLHEWEWDDTTGSIWRQVSDSTGIQDAFFAYGSAYLQFAIKSPRTCWRLENFALNPS